MYGSLLVKCPAVPDCFTWLQLVSQEAITARSLDNQMTFCKVKSEWRNGESAQNRKLLWSPDVSLEAFGSFRTLHVECNSTRTWKWGWDIQGRGTMAILAVVNVESANVLNINSKMGLLQLQRKIIHIKQLQHNQARSENSSENTSSTDYG
ncbi:hypothetical protein BDL97_12G098500 [Sphagnum fallax]|nr:hypothetical protein BDL97_12G098500 [Sphagnum fallax]